jgi:hypothetical protein
MSCPRYEVEIPDWLPATVNQLLRGVRQRIRLKQSDRSIMGGYLLRARLPPPSGPRRVSLRLTLGPRDRERDVDSSWKSVLDALVQAGALRGDDVHSCQLGAVEIGRGGRRSTVIVLEDLDGPQNAQEAHCGGDEPSEGP